MAYVRGKRGRKVPIILSKDVIKAMDCLIQTRSTVGVEPGNKFVFAAPTRGSVNFLRGHDCLAAVVDRLQLKEPSAIKSTKLRKYIATVSQIVDLNSAELDWLARHLGHDIAVHRDFYRLQDHNIELSKVSRLLLAVDEGNASKWAGKRLDDIDLDGMCIFVTFQTHINSIHISGIIIALLHSS